MGAPVALVRDDGPILAAVARQLNDDTKSIIHRRMKEDANLEQGALLRAYPEEMQHAAANGLHSGEQQEAAMRGIRQRHLRSSIRLDSPQAQQQEIKWRLGGRGRIKSLLYEAAAQANIKLGASWNGRVFA